MLNTFIQFLQENNALEKYTKNTIEAKTCKYNSFYDRKTTCACFLVSEAFMWLSTNEGFDFWEKIHLIWYDISNKSLQAISYSEVIDQCLLKQYNYMPLSIF